MLEHVLGAGIEVERCDPLTPGARIDLLNEFAPDGASYELSTPPAQNTSEPR